MPDETWSTLRMSAAAAMAASAWQLGAAAAFAAPAVTTPHPLVVEVTTSPRAQAQLRSLGEKVKINAFYAGPPIPARRRMAVEGEISLGPEENVVLPLEGGTARLRGEMSSTKLRWVTEPHILINIVSARLRHPDNLLACDAYENLVAVARKEPVKIHCKLIVEE